MAMSDEYRVKRMNERMKKGMSMGDAVPAQPTMDEDAQVSYDDYKARALAMGAKETASPDEYEEIRARLGSALAKRKKKGLMDTAKEWVTPDYAKISAESTNRI